MSNATLPQIATAQRLHNLALRSKPDSLFAPTETLKIAPITALPSSGQVDAGLLKCKSGASTPLCYGMIWRMISLELTKTPGMPSGAGASGQAVAGYGKLSFGTE